MFFVVSDYFKDPAIVFVDSQKDVEPLLQSLAEARPEYIYFEAELSPVPDVPFNLTKEHLGQLIAAHKCGHPSAIAEDIDIRQADHLLKQIEKMIMSEGFYF